MSHELRESAHDALASNGDAFHAGPQDEPLAIVGMDCRVPGADGLNAYAQLLAQGRSGISELAPDLLQRDLYFDSRRGQPGKTYATLAGMTSTRAVDPKLLGLDAKSLAEWDEVHVRFAEVAVRAWQMAGIPVESGVQAQTGVFVGHSGATQLGGWANYVAQVEEALEFLTDVPGWLKLSASQRDRVRQDVLRQARHGRPVRETNRLFHFEAYEAARLTAQALQVSGPCAVVDAACASSLFGLQQARLAISLGRLDCAIVGGATTNGVENLILFSQSQACSADGSRPFDDGAAGLISSEGYAALVVMRASLAEKWKLKPLATIVGMGVACDGRGKSLWAPRAEGQVLAMQRAYTDNAPLSIDYLEAHATSTQLGDATELNAVQQLRVQLPAGTPPLLVGSVKSNLGHTLETAGLSGLIKVLLALRAGEIPRTLNFRQPNRNFDWTTSRLKIVDQSQAWPVAAGQRRAAVSAFGIGGLNAHVVVTDAPAVKVTQRSQRESREPLAIIGRGVVLPGAHHLQAFRQLLQSGASQIGPPPADRWRNQVGVQATATGAARTPTAQAGYIRDYQFDSTAFRIPPKQVKQANPVQLMLLDAVRQCAQEFDQGEWGIDRQRTGVVIGSIFGGEFGNQLHVGLHLPELQQQLQAALREIGWSAADARLLSEAFRQKYLDERPALLDETGSFTASTLASRVAKTFDLMGGACAVDADGASSLYGISVAADALHAGEWTFAICGAAQRALDLASFATLSLRGQLVASGKPSDIPDDLSRILPGEGVAAVLLTTLSRAKSIGAKILGIIDDVTVVRVSAANPGTPPAGQDLKLARQIGWLAGGQGLVQLVGQSLSWESANSGAQPERVEIAARTVDNLCYTMRCRSAQTPASPVHPSPSGLVQSVTNPKSPFSAATQIVRFAATSREALQQQLESAQREPEQAWSHPLASFADAPVHRLSVLSESPAELGPRLQAVLKALQKGKRRGILETERAILTDSLPGTQRVAWLFPGQGSQYAHAACDFLQRPAAQGAIAELDAALRNNRTETFTEFLQTGVERAAQDLWGNQLWALGHHLALQAELTAQGLRPDVVLGHSFGEFSALVAAGSLSVQQVTAMVKARAEAVALTVRERGQLISVRGEPARVEAVLRTKALPAVLTHFNAPQQTVIACELHDVAAVRASLTGENLASLEVSVPAAYHTPRMEAAEALLRQHFLNVKFLAPRCGVLSSTTCRFIAEPEDLREALVRQMTRAVQWTPAVQRLVNEGCTLLLEVGPNNVLTRLCQEIVGDAAYCFAIDLPGRPAAERLLMLQAVVETLQLAGGNVRGLQLANEAPHPVQVPASSGAARIDGVEVVDLRKSQRRRSTASSPEPAVEIATAATVVPPPLPVPAAAPVTTTGRGVQRFLVNLVMDLTGYEESVIDFDADLEADLGVDSIKKAQIVGEVAENFGLAVAPSQMKLADFRTLADIARLASANAIVEPIEPVPLVAEPAPVGVAAGANGRRASMEQFLIDLVVDQTGYAPDVVDLDADMESDLGIDSIKQAQLFGELQQQFSLQVATAERGKLTSFTTLRSILDYLERALPEGGSTGFKVRVDEPAPRAQPHRHAGNGVKAESPPLTVRPGGPHWENGVTPTDEMPADWKVFFKDYDQGSPQARWDDAFERGQTHRAEIRAALRLLVDQHAQLTEVDTADTGIISPGLEGLAAGAGVSAPAVLRAQKLFHRKQITQRETANPPVEAEPAITNQAAAVQPAPLDVRHSMRFALRMVAAPRRANTPTVPEWNGPALIVGDNDLARAIQKRFEASGHAAYVLSPVQSLGELDRQLTERWERELTPHLFIVTPHDPAALTKLDAQRWRERRFAALQVPYRVCQLWMQRMIDAGRIDNASVVALTCLGGDFGFSGKQVRSPEGGIGALLKAMMIEGWMRGVRSTPIKVLDIAPQTSTQQAVDQLWRELAVSSYDPEIAIRGDQRYIVQPAHIPLSGDAAGQVTSHITPGGSWLVAGGGRGITAVVARELAARHGLKLHLVSASPVPNVSDATRAAAQRDRSQLRREVIAQATERGENAMEAWRRVEKGIEIDATLRACHDVGVQATYHCCDISDAAAVRDLVDRIRREDGPLRGVIQGAGFGQDARFDRKRADKVDQCLSAKIDGAINLMDATRRDPLDWFVAFGSISGRFGANGHTDYSLANDMLAKIVDRYRSERPDVRSVTFHWHAWGDIGMATKPETRLALEMINMEFMPAAEGLAHFLAELERGGDEPEVLITDRNYFRKFFPKERGFQHPATLPEAQRLPLLDPGETGLPSGGSTFEVELHPEKDRFLAQHLVDGKPTLPFVVAIELMAEAARKAAGQGVVSQATDIVASQAIKFATEQPQTIRITTELIGPQQVQCRLLGDIVRRDGRIVTRDKEFFRATFQVTSQPRELGSAELSAAHGEWTKLNYPSPGGAMYHGPDLQLLKQFRTEGRRSTGTIIAAPNSHLGGERRPTTGWTVPCAVLDACLYACVFADRLFETPTLPVSFEKLEFGRLPDSGETCQVRVELQSRDPRGASLDFELIGQNGEVLLRATGHRVGIRETALPSV